MRDDARKIMLLDTDDGKAILGYAGLGATALGTEPADWMSAVLRGRRISLEQSLGVLAEAIKKQLPRHLVQIRGNARLVHNVIVPAFVQNEPRLYSIDLAFSTDRKDIWFRCTRHVNDRAAPDKPRTPRLGVAGSGSRYLLERKEKMWMRNTLRILKAYDAERLSANSVADHFAALNYEVHRGLDDETVGPRCIVAWRNGKDAARRGGGAHRYYTGTTVDTESPALPTVGNGMDIRAVVSVVMKHFMATFPAMMKGQQPAEPDLNQINADLARIPDKPDEDLR
jgi:hypothetical protein